MAPCLLDNAERIVSFETSFLESSFRNWFLLPLARPDWNNDRSIDRSVGRLNRFTSVVRLVVRLRLIVVAAVTSHDMIVFVFLAVAAMVMLCRSCGFLVVSGACAALPDTHVVHTQVVQHHLPVQCVPFVAISVLWLNDPFLAAISAVSLPLRLCYVTVAVIVVVSSGSCPTPRSCSTSWRSRSWTGWRRFPTKSTSEDSRRRSIQRWGGMG